MRKAALNELAAPPQYTLAVLAPHPPPVRIHRLLLSLLARPVPPPLLFLLRNVAAHLVTLHPLDHRAAVVALIRNQLFDPANVDLGRIAGPQLGLAPHLFRHRHARFAQRLVQRRRVALIRTLQRHRHHRTRVQIDRVLGLVRQVRAPVFHLRHSRILVRWTLPLLVRRAFLAFTIQSCQVFAAWGCDARGLGQSSQKLRGALARVAPHNRAHRRVGLQRRRINRDPLPLQQPTIRQHTQHPSEYFPMGVQIDQPPRPRDGGVIRRVLVQANAHKTPQRQRVRQPPSNAALRPDALEIPDQQRTKVDPRRQRGPPVLDRIELCTASLDKLVEALSFQQLIQLLVEGMPRRGCQLPVRDPQSLLLLPLLARAHRHRAILRTMSVDTSDVLAYEPRLAPRAARGDAFAIHSQYIARTLM